MKFIKKFGGWILSFILAASLFLSQYLADNPLPTDEVVPVDSTITAQPVQ